MQWENGYSCTRTIEDVKHDYEDIKKMIDEYDHQIVAIDEKIARLKKEFGKGTAQRILTLEGMKSNLLYAYRGLCSNERAIKERLEKMTNDKISISKIEAGE